MAEEPSWVLVARTGTPVPEIDTVWVIDGEPPVSEKLAVKVPVAPG